MSQSKSLQPIAAAPFPLGSTSLAPPRRSPVRVDDLEPQLAASLCQLGVDPAAVIVSVLVDAASEGRSDIIRLLMPQADLDIYGRLALRLAAHHGHLECLLLLLPAADQDLPPASRKSMFEALSSAALQGHPECVKALLPFAHPRINEAFSALSFAAANGHSECVLALLESVPGPGAISRALCEASKAAQQESIALLAPLADAEGLLAALNAAATAAHPASVSILAASWAALPGSPTLNCEPLCIAASLGQLESVNLLIPASNPKDGNSIALRHAAIKGHDDCVQALIGLSDAKALQSEALASAISLGHAGCGRLLLPESDPDSLSLQAFLTAVASDFPHPMAEAICAMSRGGDSIPLALLAASAIEHGSPDCLGLILFGLPRSPFASGAARCADEAFSSPSLGNASAGFGSAGLARLVSLAKDCPSREVEEMLSALFERCALEQSAPKALKAPPLANATRRSL